MKKFKFLSVLLIASAMSLAGCNETQPQDPTDGGDGTQEGGEGQGGGEQGGGGSQGGGEQGGGGSEGGDTEKTTTILIADFGVPKETEFGTQTMAGFTIKTEAGTNSSNPPIAPKIYEDGKELRVYAGNVVTISGAQIKKITFTATYKNNGVVEFESGTFADLVWQGDTDSVKFSCTTGQFRITQLVIVSTGEGGSQGGGGETSEYTPLSVINDFNDTIFDGEGEAIETEDSYALYVYWGAKEDYPELTDALDELIASYSPEYVQYEKEYISDEEYGYYEDETTFVSTPAIVAVGIAGDVCIEAYAYYYTEDDEECCGLDVYTFAAE